MSEYHFGVSRVRILRRDAKEIERIAKKHGVTFIETTLPGTGYQRWFAGPNLGYPFDKALSDAVYADMDASGVGWDEIEARGLADADRRRKHRT